MIKIKKLIKQNVQFLRNFKTFYKYGGNITVNVASIKYGSIFSDKRVVLITGGTSGIGLAMCKRFLEEGAKVVIVGRDKNKLESVKKELQHNNLFIEEWDIANLNHLNERITRIERIVGDKIAIVVNNAGIYAQTQFPHCTEEDWENVYNINAKATFFICQEFCNRWMDEKECNNVVKKIINISSQGGCVVANNPYRMTKWDIRGLTKYLGSAYCKHGIIVNGIAPGFVMTNMQSSFQKQGDNLYTELNPIRRISLPIEVA